MSHDQHTHPSFSLTGVVAPSAGTRSMADDSTSLRSKSSKQKSGARKSCFHDEQSNGSRTCWIIGKVGIVQRAMFNLGFLIALSMSEQQLSSNTQSQSALESDSSLRPDLVVIDLPGTVNQLGNAHDKKILRNIQSIVDHCLAQGYQLVLVGNERSKSWNHLNVQRPQLHNMSTNWCHFNVIHQKQVVSRAIRVVSTLCLPVSFTMTCKHSTHVTVRSPEDELKIHAMQSIIQSLLGDRAESKYETTQRAEVFATQKNLVKNQHPDNLGDHVVSSIQDDAEKSVARGKKIEVEEHYDDCGDDLAVIHLEEKENSNDETSFFDIQEIEHYCQSHSMTIGQQDNDTSNFECLNHYFDHQQKKSKSFRKHDIAQLFGGNANAIKLGMSYGMFVGRNFDAVVGIDLTDDQQKQQLFSYLNRHRPRVLICSPPCTSFGPWSHINKHRARATWLKSHRIGKQLAAVTIRSCEIQLQHGNHFIIENPYTSTMWYLPDMIGLSRRQNVCSSRIDQCMYGLKDPTGHHLMYKPTGFLASHASLLVSLQRRCDRKHEHQQIRGSIAGKQISKHAQQWPKSLNKAVIDGVLNLFNNQLTYTINEGKPTELDVDTGPAPVPAAPSSCPGCRSHARRDDPRHNRHPTVCKFPLDQTKHWKCAACLRHAASRAREHTRILGECQWADARIRRTHPRGQDTEPIEADEETLIPGENKPPRTGVGDWKPMTSDISINKLNEVSRRDGWTVINGWPTLIVFMGSALRTCSPHYRTTTYPLRTSYGMFPECIPQWWFLETGAAHNDIDRVPIGYQVPVLVMMFHALVNIPRDEIQTIPRRRAVGDDHDIIAEVTGTPNPSMRRPNQNEQLTPPGSPRETVGRRIQDEGDLAIAVTTPADAEEIEHGGESANPPGIEIPRAEPGEWSSWQLGRALKGFRSDNHAVHVKTIRQLHIRFWHASVERLQSLLRGVSIPKHIVELVPSVVNSCRVCRLWQRPMNKSVTTTRISNDFNQVMQVDLLFVEDQIICHMIDEATRFTLAVSIKSRKAEDIQEVITMHWIRMFGPPDVILTDQEGGLHGESASVWAERLGTTLRFKARGSHAQIVERHHEILRQQLHRMLAQVRSEGLEISFEEILAEATYAKNIMTSVHGVSPFQAVFGRFPRILVDLENSGISSLDDHKGTCKHASRVREIAISQIVEGISQDRLRLANSSKTRTSGEELNLKPGDQVDIFRSPQNKDLSGWRGPCIVVNVLNITDGYVDVKWQGRTMSARIQDIRRHIPFVAFMELPDVPIVRIRQHLTSIKDTTHMISAVPTKQGWMLSQAAKQNIDLFRCVLFVARNFVHLSYCIGARLGRGVTYAHGIHFVLSSVLVWYDVNKPEEYHIMFVSANQTLKLRSLFNGDTQNTAWIQFLTCEPEEAQSIRTIDPTEEQLATPTPSTISSTSSDSSIGRSRSSKPRSSISSESLAPPQTGAPPYPPGAPMVPQPSADDSRSRSSRGSETEPSLMPVSTSSHETPVQDAILTESSASSRDKRSVQSWSRSRSSRSPVVSSASKTVSILKTPVSSEHQSDRSRSERRLKFQKQDSDKSSQGPHPEARSSHEARPLPIASSNSSRTLESVPETIPYEETETEQMRNPVVSSNNRTHSDQTIDYGSQQDEVESLTSTIPEHHEFIALQPSSTYIMDGNLLEFLVAENFNKQTSVSTYSTLGQWSNSVQIELKPIHASLLAEPIFVPPGSILVYTVTEEETTTQIEKDCDTLSAEDLRRHWGMVEEAIRKELKSFDELEVLSAEDISVVKNIMSSRWVLRWKMIDKQRAVKARLTVRGYEDLCAPSLEVYAGTATRWSQRLICSIAVQKGYTIFTWDVSTAFLQGCTFKQLSEMTGQPLRQVAFRPPKGSEKYFKELKTLAGIDFSKQVLLMNKPVYGLKDAPRAWRIRLDQALKELKGQPLLIDPAIYIWYKSNTVSLVLCTHVDDMKGCGDEETVRFVISGLEACFGKMKIQTHTFEHCGIMHEQQGDIIRIHQNHYSKQLKLLSTLGLNAQKESPLSQQQKDAFASLLGGCSWLIQTRMDIAVYVGALQRASKKATSTHYFRLNTLVRWIKRKPFFLTFRRMSVPVRVVVISDSAFRKEDKSGLALRGAIIGLTDYASSGTDSLTGNLHVIDFYSRKQRRVVRSTYGAELNALADAIEFGRLLSLCVCECMQPGISIKNLARLEETGSLPIKLDAVIDARSVYDSLRASEMKPPAESTLFMVLLQIKELLRSFSLSRLFWCDTRDMVADGLNKGAVTRTALVDLGREGRWEMKYDHLFHQESIQRIPQTGDLVDQAINSKEAN